MKYNLLVSTFRHREEDACDELLDMFEFFGDLDYETSVSKVSGLVLARTSLNIFDFISKLKEIISKEPWRIRFILRVVPLEIVVASKIEDIKEATLNLIFKIKESESFRITVEKRHSQLATLEIISQIGRLLKNKVDLHRPDWIILVEVMGLSSGISVLKPDQIFSSIREKRNNAIS